MFSVTKIEQFFIFRDSMTDKTVITKSNDAKIKDLKKLIICACKVTGQRENLTRNI